MSCRQQFKTAYTAQWPCIIPSRKGAYFAQCTICSSDFSVKHGGQYDIKLHIKTPKHADNVRAKEATVSMMNFVSSSKDNASGVIKAECLMTNFIVEHNLPIAVADHMTALVKKMFPDSDIAKQYSSKRTKSTYLIHHMADECKRSMSGIISDNPFSIATDGSSDRGCESQLYPIVIRYYDPAVGKILTGLISLPPCLGASTGENIFKLLDKEVEKHSDWKFCISYCSDNASVMMGKKKGVAAFVTTQHSDIFVTGCTCHLIHLAASKAADSIKTVNVAQLLVDIYYYLDKSTKRKKMLKELQGLCGTEALTVIKHCSTRWLSLEFAINRLLQLWEPIYQFFEKENSAIKPKNKKPVTAEKKNTGSEDGKQSSTVKLNNKKPVAQAAEKKNTGSEDGKQSSTVKLKKKKPVAQAAEKKNTVGKDTSTVKLKRTHSVTTENSNAEIKKLKLDKGKKNQPEDLGASHKKSSQGKADNPEVSATKKDDKLTDAGLLKDDTPEDTPENTANSCFLPKAAKVFKTMQRPHTKLYCLFLQSVVPEFNSLNLLLQKDEPQILYLLPKCLELLTNLFVRFVKADVIASAENIADVKYDDRVNQKDREDLMIGQATRQYLEECKTNKQMTSADRTDFFGTVRTYYSTAVEYILKKFPLQDELLTHVRAADIPRRKEVKFSSVKYLVDRFPCLMPPNATLDQLQTQFLRYQVAQLPTPVLNAARCDVAWHFLSQEKEIDSGESKFGILTAVMLGVLVIPHSNADAERIFSTVRKNNTEFRPNMGTRLLESLIITKTDRFAKDTVCHKIEFSTEFLKNAKQATYKALSSSKATAAVSKTEDAGLSKCNDLVLDLILDNGTE